MSDGSTSRPGAELLVVAGTERVRVTGRAAVIIAQAAACAERINAMPIGKFIAHFAHGQVKLELRESLPAIRLDTD